MAEEGHVSGLRERRDPALTLEHISNLDGHQTLMIPQLLDQNVVGYHAMSDRFRMTRTVNNLEMNVVVLPDFKSSRRAFLPGRVTMLFDESKEIRRDHFDPLSPTESESGDDFRWCDRQAIFYINLRI